MPAEPITATGSAPRNVDGQAIAITVFSSVKWLGRLWLPLVFWYAKHFPKSTGTLGRLSFIHFARWTLVRRIPYNGPPQRQEQLSYPRLFFESNFNGGWEEYIDAFSYVLTTGMWGLLGQLLWLSATRCRQVRSSNTSETTNSTRTTTTRRTRGDKHDDSFGARDRPEALRRCGRKPDRCRPEQFQRRGKLAHGRTVVSLNNNKAGKMYALTVFTPIITDRLGELRDLLEGFTPDPAPATS